MSGRDVDTHFDLIGGSFAVIESDPGVFSMLMRKLGVKGLEVTEVYDIEPWAVDHLDPHGLIFCYLCREDSAETRPDSGSCGSEDPDAAHVWFANQLSDDACASQAILNVALNCQGVELGDNLREFQSETENMSPVMKGLAISNCQFIREAHNSLARPADIRASLHGIAAATLESSKQKKSIMKSSVSDPSSPPVKRRKTGNSSGQTKRPAAKATVKQGDDTLEAYHFIGYVPINGKVWELDGLRECGPLEVGEIPGWPHTNGPHARKGWMDVVRPALRMKMQRYLSSESEQDIRYNLLAIVDDRYQKASDALEMLKRERIALERRLNESFPGGWADKVDASLLATASETSVTSVQSSALGATYSRDFGSQKMEKEMAILDMPIRHLPEAWEACAKATIPAKVAVEDELGNNIRAHTDHISRTFDYEHFIQTFVSCLQGEGLLQQVLSSRKKNPTDESKQKGKSKR